MPLAATSSRLAPLAPSTAGGAPDAVPGAEHCVTCGQPAGTPYCPHCGERRAADHAYTIRALAAELWEFVTPADGRTLRSLWTLVRRPGALTAAYMRGERRPFLTPLGVFVAVNAGYFVFVSITGANTFTTPLQIQTTGVLYQRTARALVEHRLSERRVTFAAYARRFDAAAAGQAKSLVGVMVPEFALLVAAVQLRRRRPALHHLTFALHVTAVFLLVLMAVGVVGGLALESVRRGFGVHVTSQGIDNITSLGVVAAFGAWLAAAFRRAYGDGPLASVVKAGFVALLTFEVVVSAYRALLFFTTFWTT